MAQSDFSTNSTTTDQIGQTVDEMMSKARDSRRTFERRWYDNNFFDDGFHFRFLSRQSNKIVDLAERASIYNPMRAIPKSSKQIRGLANLLLSKEPTPTVYPEKIDKAQYPSVAQTDPQTGQPVNLPNPDYQRALAEAKRIAQLSGHWLEEEFKKQELQEKLALMIVLAAKHGVSYMQIWPDAEEEAVKTQVFDAFDIYINGSLTSIYDAPFIIKSAKTLISNIKANSDFDQDQLDKISPDNRHASSEIKEAYMKARFGGESNPDQAATVLLKEAFIKEHINEENKARIKAQKNGAELLKNRDDGDTIIRQVFVAGNIWLRDEYLDLPDYPFVDFRLEPGPIYQVPLIERFMPANKSLDLVVSRIERYTHTMVTGSWSKRQGEQFEIDNTAGGQIIEYQNTAPIQNQIAPIPQFVFEFSNLLQSIINEEGITTAILGKLPPGIRSGAAIEALKASEYSNLLITSKMLQGTIKRIAEKCLDIADSYFITPQTVYYMNKGEPNYFDIIGHSSLSKRKGLKINTNEDVVPLKQDYRVDIEIESGLGYTKDGQKQTILELVKELNPYFQEQLIPPEALKVLLEKLMETYQFGSTAEFMDAIEEGQVSFNDQDTQKVKTAMMEVMSDLNKGGILPGQEDRIKENTLGAAQALKDTGVAGKPEPQGKPISESLNYKDAPEDIKRQIEQQAGLRPSEGISPSGSKQVADHATAATTLNPPQQTGGTA